MSETLKPCRVTSDGWCQEHNSKGLMDGVIYCEATGFRTPDTASLQARIAGLESELNEWHKKYLRREADHADDLNSIRSEAKAEAFEEASIHTANNGDDAGRWAKAKAAALRSEVKR